jgi:hypothetical protein
MRRNSLSKIHAKRTRLPLSVDRSRLRKHQGAAAALQIFHAAHYDSVCGMLFGSCEKIKHLQHVSACLLISFSQIRWFSTRHVCIRLRCGGLLMVIDNEAGYSRSLNLVFGRYAAAMLICSTERTADIYSG